MKHDRVCFVVAVAVASAGVVGVVLVFLVLVCANLFTYIRSGKGSGDQNLWLSVL